MNSKPRATYFLFLRALEKLTAIYASLCQNHADFDQCCFRAQNFDDNFEFVPHNSNQAALELADTIRQDDLQIIVDLIVRKLRQDTRVNQAYRDYR